jgi:hypothetical protein
MELHPIPQAEDTRMRLLLWIRKGLRRDGGELAGQAQVAGDNGFDSDRHFSAALAPLEAKHGARMRFRHPAWDTPPAYVVVPRLPPDVAYQIVRDPASRLPRVILFSASTITDELLYSSVGCLAIDERRAPTTETVRTITRFTNDWYEVVADGKVFRKQTFRGARTANDPLRSRGPDSVRVLRAAASGKEVEVLPGVRGRLFKPVC